MPVSSKGNALFLILIAVALFAALSYAITQSGRGSGNTTRENETLKVAQMVQFAGRVSAAVNRLKLINGCSDTQISFEATQTGTLFQNASAPIDKSCHVFDPAGGGVAYEAPDPSILDASQSSMKYYGKYLFTGKTYFVNFGVLNEPELAMFTPYLTHSACRRVVEKTTGYPSGTTLPRSNNLTYDDRSSSTAEFKGVYLYQAGYGLIEGTNSTFFNGVSTGCYNGQFIPASGTYHYFNVLIAR